MIFSRLFYSCFYTLWTCWKSTVFRGQSSISGTAGDAFNRTGPLGTKPLRSNNSSSKTARTSSKSIPIGDVPMASGHPAHLIWTPWTMRCGVFLKKKRVRSPTRQLNRWSALWSRRGMKSALIHWRRSSMTSQGDWKHVSKQMVVILNKFLFLLLLLLLLLWFK